MKHRAAFTLMELMIVVAVIGILGAIAVTRFGGVMENAKEGATRGALSSVRSALEIYYGDNLGHPTDDLASLTSDARYLSSLPIIKLPGTGHPENRHVSVGASTAAAVDDTGGWAYVNDPASSSYGTLLINCTHLDAKGKRWDEQ